MYKFLNEKYTNGQAYPSETRLNADKSFENKRLTQDYGENLEKLN